MKESAGMQVRQSFSVCAWNRSSIYIFSISCALSGKLSCRSDDRLCIASVKCHLINPPVSGCVADFNSVLCLLIRGNLASARERKLAALYAPHRKYNRKL